MRRRSVGFFYEMRLGKTLLTARWGNSRAGMRRALVLCPREVIPGWLSELAMEGETPVELSGPVVKRVETVAANHGRKWFVTNWEGLIQRCGKRSVASEIARLPWDLVVADESTRIKSPKAHVTKIALDYLSQAPYKAILSGLPNPEGPEELVTQMLFLNGGRLMGCSNFWEWRAKHMQAVGYEWAVKRESLKELKAAVDASCKFMSLRQAGLGNVKVAQRRWIDLPKKVLDAMRRAERDYQVGERLAMNKLQVITWLLQLAGGRYPDPEFQHDAKIDEAVRLAKGELSGKPVVAWCKFNEEVDALASALKRAGVSVEIATGATRNYNRENVARFQAGRFKWLVCQSRLFMYGKDLSRSSVALYYSNYFDLEVRRQTEMRIEHITKNEPLLHLDLVARGTMDEDVLDALVDKNIDAASFKRTVLHKLAARRAA